MDIDSFVSTAIGLSPNLGVQLFPGDDAPCVCGEVSEQVEFLAVARDRFAVEGHEPGSDVDRDAADGECVRWSAQLQTSQQRSDPRSKFSTGEGFDDVFVSSGIEHANDLGVVVSGRRNDDRNIGNGPDHAKQIRTVEVG